MTAQALAAALCLLAGQAPPRDAPAPAAAGTGAIRGRVIVAGTNSIVPGALVTVSGTREHPMPPREVSAAAGGTFELAGLAAGPYTLNARPGRYQLQFLASTSPVQVTVIDGQTTTGVDLALPRASAIVGRAVDEFGQPMGGMPITSQRVGDRPGVNQRSTTSDEYGRYRLYNLSPGTYYILARPEQFSFVDPRSTARVGYVETYHPGAASRDEAVRVEVRPSEEVDAGDLRVMRGQLLRVRGVVVDSQGKTPPQNRTMVSFGSFRAGSESRNLDANGGFDFGLRVPGPYTLSAAIRPEAGESIVEFGTEDLTLTDQDADRIVLALTPSARVGGRVVIEDGTAPSLSGLSVRADWGQPSMIYTGIASAPVTSDLAFTFDRLAGARLLRISGTANTKLVLKAVMRGTQDVTNLPTVFASDDAIRVVLSSHVSQIEGNVSNDGGRPAAGVDVIVFSEDRRTWVRSSTAVQQLWTDPRGHFLSGAMPPGRYYLIAVTQDRGLRTDDVDRAVLEQFVRDATTVVLGEDERRQADLKLTTGGGGL
jgi:hypothetical protein